jgi:hypothetical protein
MEEHLQKLEREIASIQQRNSKVEADKAWETSLFRKVLISVVTYIIASIVMCVIGVEDYSLSALIPTIGYILSTLSLPFIKKWWIKKYVKKT